MSRKASGLKAWALQRLTAIYVAAFALYLLAVLLLTPPAGFTEWKAFVGGPWVSVLMLLFIASLLLHAWIGLRDVLIDYVKPISVRASILGVIALTLVGLGLWAAQALVLVRLA